MNKSMSIKVFLLFFFICLFFTSNLFAGVPQLLNYQGTLTDTSGTPVPDGQYAVVFNIYDVATGGSPLWTETWNGSTSPVTTIKGNFNAILGAYNPIPASFFDGHPTTYLGIKVGNDSEMMPRQRITSVAYAFTAGSGGIPRGAIIMWSGAIDQIPAGWALCDGQNGTPDLRNRFIVGAGSGYSIGATGGEATHILTINEMPSHTHIQNAHNHALTDPGHSHNIDLLGGGGSGNRCVDAAATEESNPPNWSGIVSPAFTGISINDATPTNQNAGGGAAHENRPPYYALAFIMKL